MWCNFGHVTFENPNQRNFRTSPRGSEQVNVRGVYWTAGSHSSRSPLNPREHTHEARRSVVLLCASFERRRGARRVMRRETHLPPTAARCQPPYGIGPHSGLRGWIHLFSFVLIKTTRWASTLSSKVNLHHIINFRANLVTLRSKFGVSAGSSSPRRGSP